MRFVRLAAGCCLLFLDGDINFWTVTCYFGVKENNDERTKRQNILIVRTRPVPCFPYCGNVNDVNDSMGVRRQL